MPNGRSSSLQFTLHRVPFHFYIRAPILHFIKRSNLKSIRGSLSRSLFSITFTKSP